MPQPRTIYQQLEHEMSCATETGNDAEVKLVVVQAESAYESRLINCEQLATLVWDSIVYQQEATC